MALADRCGLPGLLNRHVKISATGGTNAPTKLLAIIAGMVCGADSITNLDLLRHGGCRGCSPPSGPVHPGQLPATVPLRPRPPARRGRRPATGPIDRSGPALADADQLVLVDIDDTVRATYGYAKQGAGRGYTGIKGLNALLAVASTPIWAPLIAGTRLRKVWVPETVHTALTCCFAASQRPA